MHSCTSPWHKCLQTDAPPCPCAFVREGRILAEWVLQMPLMTRSIGGGGGGGSIPLGQDSSPEGAPEVATRFVRPAAAKRSLRTRPQARFGPAAARFGRRISDLDEVQASGGEHTCRLLFISCLR